MPFVLLTSFPYRITEGFFYTTESLKIDTRK